MRRIIRSVLLGWALLSLATGSAGARGRLAGVVNLNTATAEQLELLPGIGATKVTAILEYRRTRPFRTVEELVRVKGIGRKTVRRLRPHLAVSGPTTLTVEPATGTPRGAEPAESER